MLRSLRRLGFLSCCLNLRLICRAALSGAGEPTPVGLDLRVRSALCIAMRSFVAASRRLHLPLNPLHSPIAEANELRHAIDTEALSQLGPRPGDRARIIQRAT